MNLFVVVSGDLSYQFYIKKRQNCKSFSYFMEVVAPGKLSTTLGRVGSRNNINNFRFRYAW